MPQRQFTTPLVIGGLRDPSAASETTYLQRIPFERDMAERSGMFDEPWLQQLLFKHPALLPIGEIEPIFENPIPVVRELPVGTGALDLLYINAEGFLTVKIPSAVWPLTVRRRTSIAISVGGA